MASFNQTRAAAYDQVQRGQHYRSHILGLNAFERHKKFVNDYLQFYSHDGAGTAKQDPYAQTQKTDLDALRDSHRFLRTAADDESDSWEVRLAKKYYSKLFKEYAIADLSRYKESKLGLRWRTQKEVIVGKGQFTCGAKGCDNKDGLCSYEVNFVYQEAGQQKQALVKVRLCPDHAYKLNYKREKQYRKVQASVKRSRADEPQGQKRKHRVKRRHSERDNGAGTASARDSDEDAEGGATDEQEEEDGDVPAELRNATDAVWEQPLTQEVSAEEEFDKYFEGMFV